MARRTQTAYFSFSSGTHTETIEGVQRTGKYMLYNLDSPKRDHWTVDASTFDSLKIIDKHPEPGYQPNDTEIKTNLDVTKLGICSPKHLVRYVVYTNGAGVVPAAGERSLKYEEGGYFIARIVPGEDYSAIQKDVFDRTWTRLDSGTSER